jgi:hypothetical protein
MDLNHLAVFQAVARAGGMTLGAGRLDVSQPAAVRTGARGGGSDGGERALEQPRKDPAVENDVLTGDESRMGAAQEGASGAGLDYRRRGSEARRRSGRSISSVYPARILGHLPPAK